MLKKTVLLLLTLSMLLAALVGCKNKKEEEETTTYTKSSDSVDPDGDTIGTYDFGGKDFTILTRQETKYEFGSDVGLGGDVIDRAVYERNYNVTERFKVKLNIVDKKGGWEERRDFLSAVRAEAMSGGGGYDLVSTHSVYLGWMTVEGLAADMADLPELDFSKSWWNQNLYDEININEHVFFMLGDICATTYEYMQVMFFNETAFENYFVEEGVEVIYDLVENGEWTWEKCIQYATDYTTDGNTEVTEYGLAMNIHSWRASFISQDAYIYSRDENGDLTISETPSDKLVNVVDSMVDFYSKSNIYFYTAQWDTGASVLNKEFTGGNVLFYPQTLGEVKNIANSMTAQYGVIPLPKYDNYQEKYYTICRDTVSAVMIMTTSENQDMAGVITEALCMYGRKIVTPEYYELALKVRYFSDEKYSKIIDTIRDGLTIQPVSCYIEGAPSNDIFLTQVTNGKKGEVVSTYTNNAISAKNMLVTFYANLKKQGLY